MGISVLEEGGVLFFYVFFFFFQMNPTEMKEFLLNAMTNFKNKNRKYPKQVIIYRDGIASTQIDHVQKNEMTGINSALRELGCDKGRNKTKIQVKNFIL